MKNRILSLGLALCTVATTFMAMPCQVMAAAVSYVQDFEKANTIGDVKELTIVGGNASIVNDNGNKALRVTGGEKVTICAPASTTKKTIEVSYKMKVLKTGGGSWNSFAAMQGANEVAAAFRIGTSFHQYIKTAGTNNNQSLFYMTSNDSSVPTVSGDGKYHEIKYKIDFEHNRVYPSVDGDGSMITAKVPVRTEGATGVDSVYFDVPAGDEIYFDDIKIKEEVLELKSAFPENNTKNYMMRKNITLQLSAQVSSEYLTKEYFELYENGNIVSSYTIAQPSAGEITITPANGFKGNSTYEVVIKNTVNLDVEGFTTTPTDIRYKFTTEGFLVTAVDDDTYGGKVLVNGKTYTFRASYKNDTSKTQNPVILLATTKNGRMDSVEVKEGYSVAAGETIDFSFNYTASDMDENTKVSILLWNGLDTIIPLAESTVVKGEYADGTPAYEEKLLKELKEKYESKNISGFNIGLITDVQPGTMIGYKTFLHHYKSITKAADVIDLDCFADLGDMINHSFDKQAGIDMFKAQSSVLLEKGLPVFRVKGNHDDNRSAVFAKQDDSYFITDDEWVEGCDANWATVMDGTTAGVKPYYYKDFDEHKLRVIAINMVDIPFSYPEVTSFLFGLSQEQLEWFADEALDFSDKSDKSEWGVVLLGHVIGGGSGGVELQKILQAFMEGKSGTIESGGIYTPIENLSYDFTAQGAMEFIAAFDGHTHYDRSGLILGKPLITTASSLPDEDYGIIRELKSESEDSWDIVTIDRENRKIYCTRFGAGEDREFSY